MILFSGPLEKAGGRGEERVSAPTPPKFSDNVSFFSKSLLNMSFLKIFNLKQ